MGAPEYVFCMWNKRLWPAKVLSHQYLSKKCRLSVEILVLKKQLDVNLTDTKPFLKNELQKIGDILGRKRKRTSTSEDHLYMGAVKHAVDMMKLPSFSTSGSESVPCKRAKRSAQRNRELSPEKQENSDADVSKDVLEISTRCDTGVSPTKGRSVRNMQRNKARPRDKRPYEPLCGEETVSNVSSLVKDHKSKQKNNSVGKLKGYTNPGKDTDSSTVPQKGRKKGNKKCPVQRRQPVTSKTVQKIKTDLQPESPEADTKEGNVHSVPNYMKNPMPDFEEEKGSIAALKGFSSSELSMDISPEHVSAIFSSQDDTEDIQLPVVKLQKEAAILPGSFAWCKYRRYPYWPTLVKMVDSKHKKATVVFLEQSICDPTKKRRGFKVALRTIKHYDCPEKQQFLENARKEFGKLIDWCDSLISDYRIRLGCGSFSGTFLDFCTADISLPVRREVERGKRELIFPEIAKAQQNIFSNNPQWSKKQLPDRSRAARDRANEKLVAFIVNAKEAENHLIAILEGKKKSQWLKKFQSSKRHINCLDTYIEDEQQIELMTSHLQAICVKKGSKTENLMHGDQTRFIFEVLIPEAVIFAIAATERMSYKEAEAKYLKGPLVSKRERRLFEEQILEKKKSKPVK
ncbi:PWWP domain-containing DNA repair factor 3A isoform X2 [Dendrobates tinctorius]|uniref:PWWP domain-containing DNA repair factor 3A isoform X2 n=1 Tax=Dendrobates tinctorius TaxID=92724 RepID=UPI003CC98367